MTASSFVARDTLRAKTQELDPTSVAARIAGTHRHRTRYRVKGPNRVWLVDGHYKLLVYSFEMYRIIDGYSRYVLDSYIGISTL